MFVAYLVKNQRGIRLDCRKCGHHGHIDPMSAVLRWGEDADLLKVWPKFKCSRCGAKDVSRTLTETADGSPALIDTLRWNLFHRCRNMNCVHGWWVTADELRAMFPPGSTLEDYGRESRCPMCGHRQGRAYRLTDEGPPASQKTTPAPEAKAASEGLNPRWLPPVRNR